MPLAISFLGAAKTVTGSNYLVETDKYKFIVDQGMYQGPDVEERNFLPFEFDPKEIDFMLLTHAHLDHVGLIPKLVKHGFEGPIFATLHTKQLSEVILPDSAKIQEGNYVMGIPWKHSGVIEVVYNARDVEKALTQYQTVGYDSEFEPVPGVTVTYKKVGHILGAASIEIEIDGKIIVFSGDIGRLKQPLLETFDLNYSREVDYIVMEALYGGEIHPTREENVNELIDIINTTTARGGSVFIPSFAIQRTQEVLHDLKMAKQAGALEKELPVYLDSPMAERATQIYRAALDHSEVSHFDFPGLNYVRDYKQSLKISKRPKQVIIAGSGMADGGRILGHLAANISNKRNTVTFIGYQAEATKGREIVEGAKKVFIDDRPISVRADIKYFHGFSAHGDTNDLLAWVKRYNSKKLKRIFLVHADVDRSEPLQQTLWVERIDDPYVPSWNEKVELV